MWPYEVFNQCSAMEIDFERERIGAKKKVFVAYWYGGDDNRTKRQQEEKFKKFEEAINNIDESIIVSSDVSKDKPGNKLRYRLNAIKAEFVIS